MGNFSPWMGFGLYKETIGDILQTFFISAKLNLKKVEIILHVLLNLQLYHSPSKTYKTLSSISFTTKNWNWFEFGSYWIGPWYNERRHRWCKFPIKTVLKSKFPTTVFEMDQPCHHNSVVWGVTWLTLCTWNTYRSSMGKFCATNTALRYTVKAGNWQAMTMKLAYVYYPWHFLWTKKKVVFVVITSKACSNT